MDSSVGPLSKTRKAEGRGFKSLRARITPDYLLLVDDYHPLNHLENGPQPCRQYIVKHSKVSVMKDLQLPAEEAGQEDEHYEQDPELKTRPQPDGMIEGEKLIYGQQRKRYASS